MPVTTVDGSPALKVSTVSAFHSTPMLFLMRSTISPAVTGAANGEAPRSKGETAWPATAPVTESATNSRLEMCFMVSLCNLEVRFAVAGEAPRSLLSCWTYSLILGPECQCFLGRQGSGARDCARAPVLRLPHLRWWGGCGSGPHRHSLFDQVVACNHDGLARRQLTCPVELDHDHAFDLP